MPKPKQSKKHTPSKAKQTTNRNTPNGIRAMLAEFRATHPVTGRTTKDDSYNQFRRDFFRVLHGVSIPTDHARVALDRIDSDPAEFIADVHRQLAEKRGLTEPREIARIPKGEIESEIDVAICEVVTYLNKHRVECRECFPLPELDALTPTRAHSRLRGHLQAVMRNRRSNSHYQVRCFRDADTLLQVLDVYQDFVARCREADLTDDEAHAEAEWILGFVRGAMMEIPALASEMSNLRTPEIASASVTLLRETLDGARRGVQNEALRIDHIFTLSNIAEALDEFSEKTIGRKLDAAGLIFRQDPSRAERNRNPRLYSWADVRTVFPQLPENPIAPRHVRR